MIKYTQHYKLVEETKEFKASQNSTKTPQPKPLNEYELERSKKMAIIVTPRDQLESIEAVVGQITFATVKVRNRTQINWHKGCYLGPVEKVDKSALFVVESVPITQEVSRE